MTSTTFTSERDTPPAFDISYDDNVPQRQLTDFTVTRDGDRVSICVLDDQDSHKNARSLSHPPIVVRGLLTAGSKTLRVESAPLVEWCIEYSTQDPRLWVRSQKVWYKLTKPAKEYAKTHDLARKRFEMCARIYILLTSMEPTECTFKGIAQLLYHPYRTMRGYSERDILNERQFILSQFQMLSDPVIVNSAFVRDLKTKKALSSSKKGSQHSNSSNASTPPLHDGGGTATPNFSSGSPAVGGYNSRNRRENSSSNFKNSQSNNTNNTHNNHNNLTSNSSQQQHPHAHQKDRYNSNSNYRTGRDRDRDRSDCDRDSSDHRDHVARDRTDRNFDFDRDRNYQRPVHSNARSQSHSRSQSRSHSRSRSRSRSRSPDHNTSSSPFANGHGVQSRRAPTMGGNHDLFGSASASGSRNGWEPSTQLDEDMTQRLMKKVEKAVASLMKTRNSYPFKVPVDPERDGCEDYLRRIAKPMDYGTIKKRLESKSYYKTVPEVVDDVRQVTRNCIQYNGHDHDYSKWAVALLTKFESIVRPAEETELKVRFGSVSGSQNKHSSSGPGAGKKRRAIDSGGSKTGANSSGSGLKKPAKSARKTSDRTKAGKSDSHAEGGSRAGSDDLNVATDAINIEADGSGVGMSEGDDDGTETASPKLCFRAQSQACDKPHAPNSKYCSSDCGLIVARERLAELNKTGYNPEEYIRTFITKTLVHSRT